MKDITVLPKPKLKLWIICPYCKYESSTYKKKIKRFTCPQCHTRLEGEELKNSLYYRKNGRFERYIMI